MWHINRKPKKTKYLQVRKQPGSTKTLKGSWFHTGNVVVLQKSDKKKSNISAPTIDMMVRKRMIKQTRA